MDRRPAKINRFSEGHGRITYLTVDQVIRAAWDEFAVFLDTDTPPPLIDADTVHRDDAQWVQAALAYTQAKQAAQVADEALDRAKEALVAMARHPREQGAGVSVTKYWKAGTVDYRNCRRCSRQLMPSSRSLSPCSRSRCTTG